MTDEILESLRQSNPDALLADGLESALVGVTLNNHHAVVAVYDYDRCVTALVDNGGITPEEAEEYLAFNTLDAYVGENGPLFVKFSVARTPEATGGA